MQTSTSDGKNGIKWTTRMRPEDLDFADDLALLSRAHEKMQMKTTSVAEASTYTREKARSLNRTQRIPTKSHLLEKLFRHGEFLKTIPTSFEKLQELYFLEDNMWFHSIDIPLQHPEMLEFSQFVTRTKLIPWIPESYDCNPILSSYLKYLFSEELHSVNSKPVNIHDQSINGLNLRADYRRKKISMIMETVYRAFLSARTESLVNELSTQIDERATIEI
ncbi:unnamed protein product, partial [Schistosoma mattheei]